MTSSSRVMEARGMAWCPPPTLASYPPSYFFLLSAPHPHPNSSLRFSSCFFGAKFARSQGFGLWLDQGVGK